MAKPDNVIEKRRGGSLSPDAKVNMLANMAMGWQNRLAFLATKKLISGMWVPGMFYLTSTEVQFRVDKLQTLSLKNPSALNWSLALADIIEINTRAGLVYTINEIQTGQGDFQTFRCWKSESFLQAIENARK